MSKNCPDHSAIFFSSSFTLIYIMTNKEDYLDLWKIALAQIEVKLDNPTQFKTWFSDTQLIEITNGKATLGVKNHYCADWLRRRHQLIIENTLSYVYGENVLVDYKISEELANLPMPTIATPKSIVQNPSLLDLHNGNANELYSALTKAKLNSKYTLESFVVGESNKMAHAAAVAVAENPGTAYNPYFVYGHTGLGKTHIAHGIGRRVLEKNSKAKIIYIPAEGFMNEMVKAIKSGKNIQFREKYRAEVDVLIIDDIQYISNWGSTQTEFFNTFNVLQAANKQIIIISDRSPDELQDLTPRLRSRFQGGIVVEMAKPDFEHRLAILQKKSIQLNVKLAKDLLEYIARNIIDNIRELEGALQTVVLMKHVAGENKLTVEDVAKQLGKDSATKRKKISPQHVLKIVSKEFSISVVDLKGSRRTSEIALARQICMYILRQELNYKLEEIAQILNRKDHTTVIHGIDKIGSKRLTDESFRTQLTNLTENLNTYPQN